MNKQRKPGSLRPRDFSGKDRKLLVMNKNVKKKPIEEL